MSIFTAIVCGMVLLIFLWAIYALGPAQGADDE